MNRQTLLVWLADHLDNWPSAVKYGPTIEGWLWHKDDAMNELKLHKEVKFAKPESISETEWRAECMKSVTPTEPKPLPVVEAMIDIETFDVTHDAVVFQAAVVFFTKDFEIVYQELWNLNFDEQYAAGRDVSASTIAFHLGIPANAEKALRDPEAVTMKQFTAQLIHNFDTFNPRQVWSKGSFDFNILENLIAYVACKPPWKFYQLRELRTLMIECGVKKGDVKHNALEDCLDQVERLKECRKVIKMGTRMPDTQDMLNTSIEPIERHPSNTPDSVLAKGIALHEQMADSTNSAEAGKPGKARS